MSVVLCILELCFLPLELASIVVQLFAVKFRFLQVLGHLLLVSHECLKLERQNDDIFFQRHAYECSDHA